MTWLFWLLAGLIIGGLGGWFLNEKLPKEPKATPKSGGGPDDGGEGP